MPDKKKILFFCLFLCFCSALFAQKGSVISGIVRDSSGLFLNGITVNLLKLPDSSIVGRSASNAEGRFVFTGISSGAYCVIAASLGFRKEIKGPYIVGVRDSISVIFKLLKGANVLEQVDVTGHSVYIERSPGKTILNVDRSITSSGSNALDIIRRAPGVLVGQDGGITMRGKQGVTIMMDGKVLSLSSADLTELLRNTSAGQIDKIELISNPSSNYDASGSGGLIDIKLKKNKNFGTNGNLTIGTGYGEGPKLNTSLTLNHRQNAYNLYGSWNLNDSRRVDRYFLDRRVNFEDRHTEFFIHNHDKKTLVNHSVKGGADFFIGKTQTLGVMYTGMFNRMHSVEDNNTEIFNGNVSDSTILTFSDETRRVSNNAVNLNYKADLNSGSTLNIDLDYLDYHRKSDEALSYSFYDRGHALFRSSDGLVNHTPSHITIQSFKADYSKKISGGRTLQSGFKSSLVKNSNRREIDNNSNQEWIEQSFINDKSDFKEYIHAVYANYSKVYTNKSRFEIGIRGEYTRTFGSSQSGGNVKRDYADWFPYLNISVVPAGNHKTTFSYSRRISRPAYDDLNPFRYFLDQYTYREGNPYLQPEYSTSVELSDIYKDKLTATLSYNYVKDYYLSFADQNDTTGISRTIKRNLDWFRSLGLELSYSLEVQQWLNSDLNVQGYIRRFKSGQDYRFLRNSAFLSFGAINTIKLKKGYSAQCNFSYESPTVSGMFDFRSVFMLDLGAGKSVLNNKGTLRLSVSDVFNSDRSRYSSGLSSLFLYGNQKNETRIVRLNFTYRFGSKNAGAAFSRNGGNDSERKRVGN